MVKEGYDPRFSIATTACSSVMGVIIPPSILMVVWGGVMQMSVGALFLAGAIPGLLIGFALMATVYGYAKVYDYPITLKPTFAEFWSAFKGAALAMLTPVLVIGGIVGGIVTPTESAIIAAAYALFLGVFVYRTVTFRDLGAIFYDTGRFASISLFARRDRDLPHYRRFVPFLWPVYRRNPDDHYPWHSAASRRDRRRH